MSTGDTRNDPDPFTVAAANKIIRLPVVERMRRRKFSLDSRGYDIPYLAGYSQDGSVIYIDRDLGTWVYRGRSIDTDKFLILHEDVEKSLIDAIGEQGDPDHKELLILLHMTSPDDQIYFHCHGVATALEEYMVKSYYGESALKSYNDFMATQVKRAESERITRVPRYLDMTPYQGNDRQDVHLRAVMHAAMAA